MSATNTGTPAADRPSVSTCSVLVLPVPVAPATRPCRFIIASGIPTWHRRQDGHVALDERAEREGSDR